MHTKQIITILSLLLSLVGNAQKNAAPEPAAGVRPKLVVGIVIDGLDYDRLTQLRPYFTEGGFNRLFSKGISFTDIKYGSHLDEAAATAMVFTGAAPAVNGIPSAEVYDHKARRGVSVLNAPSILGNFTDENYSPESLRVSTISDELRIDTGGLGKVYAISADPEQAIIMAGHAGNNGAWLNDRTGKWASTTFYTELPTSLQNANHLRSLSIRIDTISWVPTFQPALYDFLPSYKKIYAFRHNFPRSNADRFAAFAKSAPGNSEIASLAADYLKILRLGQGEPTDMLCLNFSLQPYTYGRDADARAETLDAYMRLDRDLANLFREVDAIGSSLIFVAGTPLNPSTLRDDEKWHLPTGDFSPARAVSLLKVNLMSIFGNGDWVSGYHNGQFFLNRDLIHERGLSLEAFRRESADFLRKMSGVTFAATVDEVISAPDTPDTPFPPARNIDINTAGDVFIAVAPGWAISDSTPDSRPVVVRTADDSSAAFILAPGVAPRTFDATIDARVLAPTLSRLLNLRAPNGAQLPPKRL